MAPCPFCQNAGALNCADPKRRFVECQRCGAGAEPADTDEGAVTNWRRRVRSFENRPSAWFHRASEAEAA